MNFSSIKKYLFFFLILFTLLSIFNFVSAQEKIEINFFYASTCHFCSQEKPFLENLEKKYPEIELKQFNIAENVGLAEELYNQYNVPEEERWLVPVTFVENNYYIGWKGEEITGKDIEAYISGLIQGNSNATTTPDNRIKLPFVGYINPLNFSPLGLSIILGALDGFNPCAIVALGFLLTLLVSTGIRKRVLLIGGTFIFVSGLVYLFFITAWLKIFLILGHQNIIALIVGIIIILFAFFALKSYLKGIVCKLCEVNFGKKENIFKKSQKFLLIQMERLSKPSTIALPLVLLGVAAVAIGVNLVELVCSLGVPLAFTKILSGLGLTNFSYYFYLLIYILFYMIDDFIIFILAVWTLRITSLSKKYLRIIQLISGILLFVLGLIMIFKPELLALV